MKKRKSKNNFWTFFDSMITFHLCNFMNQN